MIPRIAKAASGVTGTPYNELMNSWGVYFLGFVGKYGYDRILKVRSDLCVSVEAVIYPGSTASLSLICVLHPLLSALICTLYSNAFTYCLCIFVSHTVCQVLGRHVRDFVNGLDNLHEYLRFSYPKVQPPTFFCQEESATGVTLHYRCVCVSNKKAFVDQKPDLSS